MPARAPVPQSLPTATDTAVLGLGVTGWSVVRHLLARGESFAVFDTRPVPPYLAELQSRAPHIPVHTGELQPDLLRRFRRLVVSPGIAIHQPAIQAAVECGAQVLGDIELFAGMANAPVIAITGSNGKSTVTSLVAHMAARAGLKVKAGANLGEPALDLLEAGVELYVLELSSFQLETTYALKPRAAVVLNISEDHMDRYQSLDDYAAAKARIYQDCGTCVVNRDDARVMAMASDVTSFGLDAPRGPADYGLVQYEGQSWLARGDQLLLAESQMRLRFKHNVANALAALALGTAAGLPMPAMLESLRTFAGLPHRTQWVAERDGVAWFNDSKGTNVGSTLAALAGASGPVVLIAGGQGKGQDFSPLAPVLAKSGRAVVLIGEDAGIIERAIAAHVPVHRVEDMRAAVTRARQLAQPGDTVLLSPACASFDMFKGYAHRGDVFTALVREALA